MIEITEQAYAKLNLTLDVLGNRPDGYHDLRSVMQGISLCDEVQIFIGVGKEWKIVCTEPGIPTDEKNLAWRAARAFCNTVGFESRREFLPARVWEEEARMLLRFCAG